MDVQRAGDAAGRVVVAHCKEVSDAAAGQGREAGERQCVDGAAAWAGDVPGVCRVRSNQSVAAGSAAHEARDAAEGPADVGCRAIGEIDRHRGAHARVVERAAATRQLARDIARDLLAVVHELKVIVWAAAGQIGHAGECDEGRAAVSDQELSGVRAGDLPNVVARFGANEGTAAHRPADEGERRQCRRNAVDGEGGVGGTVVVDRQTRHLTKVIRRATDHQVLALQSDRVRGPGGRKNVDRHLPA